MSNKELQPIGHATRAPASQRRAPPRIEHAKASARRSTVTIDGNDVKVPLGTTILEAAREPGIRIPTLCYHEDLCVAGRVPRLRGRGRRPAHASGGLQLSRSPRRSTSAPTPPRCGRPAATSSTCCWPLIYGECYTCFRNNNCELQALAKEYGVDFFRFGHPEKPRYEIDAPATPSSAT